jgi:HK97 family phage portal protein
MGWFDWLTSRKEARSGSLENPSVPLSSATLQELGVGSVGNEAGIDLTTYKALGYAPLYQAVSQISGDCAKMPINVYRRTLQGREHLTDHPLQSLLHINGAPNTEVNAFKFWRRFFTSATLHNNGYAWIDRSNGGQVLGLYNLLPDRTTAVRYKGKLYYMTEVGGKMEALKADEVLHVEGLSIDNLCGSDMIKLFRQDFGIALARRNFTAKFFKNNMTAGGILTVPPQAKPEAVRKIATKMNEKFSGSSESAFKTLVLRDGYKWFSTQVDPEKAQLSEMDADQARNVARMYNLHPSRLGVPGSQSYNTLEMAQKDYYDGCLSHWLLSTKSEMNMKMLSESERADGVYIDYNINALLWADAATRNSIAVTGIQHGRFSPSETRAWENMNGYEGGDTFYRPLNLEPVGSKAKSDQPSRSRKRSTKSKKRAITPNESAGKTPEANAGEKTGTNPAIRRLLADSFQRAVNRVGLRAKKPYNVAEDRATLIEMLEPAIDVAIAAGDATGGDDARAWCELWIDSWFWSANQVSAEELRQLAEKNAAETMKALLGVE